MENTEDLDNYVVDVRAGIVKTKILVWACVVIVIAAITTAGLIAMFYSRKTIEKIRIIDRLGYAYSSTIIDARKATDLQIRAFLLNFCKLCYQFDKNNIENHLNRALELGDETVGGYIELHQRPNDIYQAVKGLGRVAVINEEEILSNLQLLDNSFSLAFTQWLKGSTDLAYRILITGNIIFVTPDGVDNPNGFCIVNYTETYRQLQ
jgi:hypothetical protein